MIFEECQEPIDLPVLLPNSGGNGEENMDNKQSGNFSSPHDLNWVFKPDQETGGFPWGPHKIPVRINFEGLCLTVEKCEGGMIYRREGGGDLLEKMVFTEKGRFLISPVEPFHRPVGVSTHLMIEFAAPLLIEPRASKKVQVTFPLELASAVGKRPAEAHIMEIFTLSKSKYTLYGSVRNGLICRHWKSEVFKKMPVLNPLREGVMEVAIQNASPRWVEIRKAAFSAQGMKIYFSPDLVSLKASIKIINDYSAETNFLDQPLKKGMVKALELFSARLIGLPAKTVMEEGY